MKHTKLIIAGVLALGQHSSVILLNIMMNFVS